SGIWSEGEHFGFADPISQPPIEGSDTPSYPGYGVLENDGTWRPLKAGEFLLGYEAEAGKDIVTGQSLDLTACDIFHDVTCRR
ncbi:hypothetical protein ACC677_37865, partial [Rhizobium ruizarguesonis]